MTCRIVTTERQLTAVVKVASPFNKMPETQRTARATLAAALPALEAGPVGRTCTRWTRPTGSVLPMEIGVIVARPFAPRGEVVPSELPAGRAVHLSMVPEGAARDRRHQLGDLRRHPGRRALRAARLSYDVGSLTTQL
jgi:hypothetical protein